MKKLLLLLLVVLLALAGCSSNGNTTEGETPEPTETEETEDTGSDQTDTEKRVLKVDLFEGGQGTEFLQELVDAFMAENPDVDVQVRFEKELDQVLQRENATGSYSDVVYYNLGQASAYVENQLNAGEVLEITDVFETIGDRLDPAFKETAVSHYYGDGKAYLLPFLYSPTGFFYNTELVGEGKEYPLPTTWEEFFAVGDQAKANGISLFTYPTAGYLDTAIPGSMGLAGGVDFLAEWTKYAEGTMDSEAATKVINNFSRLFTEYLHPDTVAQANGDLFTNNQQLVIDGKALFMPNGDWIVGEMAETTPEEGFHWGLLPLPAFEEGGDRAIYSYTEQIWIPKQAANPEDAKAFLAFIFSEKGEEIFLKHEKVSPIAGISEKLEGYKGEFFAQYGAENVVATTSAFTPYAAEEIPNVDFNAVFKERINDVANGTITGEQWQAELVELWNTLREHPVK